MRVLHLVDLRRAPWSVLAGVLEARRVIDARHSVVLLGGVRSARRASFAGVEADLRIAPPLETAWACRSVLERDVRGLGRFDVLHAWSTQACALGEEVRGEAALIASVFESPASMPVRAARRGARAMLGAQALQFGDEPTRSAWLDRLEPVTPGGTGVVVGPPACPERAADADALRAALGIPDGTGVIVAASEPGETVDAMLCMYIVGVLSERNMSATVIVPSDATGLDRAERFSVHHLGKWTVRVCDRPSWELLEIADGVVIADRAPCDGVRRSETVLTGAQWASGRGLPVIAPRAERYGRTLSGEVRWIDPGDRLGFVCAAHDLLVARDASAGRAGHAVAGGSAAKLYGMCGLVNA